MGRRIPGLVFLESTPFPISTTIFGGRLRTPPAILIGTGTSTPSAIRHRWAAPRFTPIVPINVEPDDVNGNPRFINGHQLLSLGYAVCHAGSVVTGGFKRAVFERCRADANLRRDSGRGVFRSYETGLAYAAGWGGRAGIHHACAPGGGVPDRTLCRRM